MTKLEQEQVNHTIRTLYKQIEYLEREIKRHRENEMIFGAAVSIVIVVLTLAWMFTK